MGTSSRLTSIDTRSSSRLRRRPACRFLQGGLEPLESRRMLAIDGLGAIDGVVSFDVNEDGIFDEGEELAGATVQLYADDGDGLFDASLDTLAASASTNDSGEYQFAGLSTGSYFVVQPTQNVSGQSFGELVSALTEVSGEVVSAQIIDVFVFGGPGGNLVVDTEPAGTPELGQTDSVDSIGTQRDFSVVVASVTGGDMDQSASMQNMGGTLFTETSEFAVGEFLVEWDGTDGIDEGFNATGLGGIDLTDGGALPGIAIRDIQTNQNGSTVELVVYTDADNYSTAAIGDLLVDEAQDVFIPFSGMVNEVGFESTAGGGADFANVGAIALRIMNTEAGTDLTLSRIDAVASDTVSVDVVNTMQVPLVDIELLTNGVPADDPDGADVPSVTVGSTVTWTYIITNTGGLDITKFEIVDDQQGIINNVVDQGDGDTILQPGESWQLTASATAVDGLYAAVATVSAETADALVTSASDSTHYRGGVSSIDIEKVTNGNQADNPDDPDVPMVEEGSTVTWTYTVTNTGTFPLTDVDVSDDQLMMAPALVADGNGDEILDVGEIWTYEATDMAIVGNYANTGTVTAMGADAVAVTDSDMSHYVGLALTNPSVDIEVSTNGNDADTPEMRIEVVEGSLVELMYVVTNSGDVPLSNVQVTDNNGTPDDDTDDFFAQFARGDENANGLLDVDETWEFQSFRVAALGDVEAIGTVTAEHESTVVTDMDASNHRGVEPTNGMSGWHNEVLVSDVNEDGVVSGQDAGNIVNEMIERNVSDPVTTELGAPPATLLYDVNDDGFVNGGDVIVVVNDLLSLPLVDLNGDEEGLNVTIVLPDNQDAVLLFDSRLVLQNEGSANLDAVTLQIVDFVAGQESLSVDVSGTSITPEFDEDTGILTLTGSDSVVNYVRALRTVKLDLTPDDASRSPIVVRVVASESGEDSAAADVSVNQPG